MLIFDYFSYRQCFCLILLIYIAFSFSFLLRKSIVFIHTIACASGNFYCFVRYSPRFICYCFHKFLGIKIATTRLLRLWLLTWLWLIYNAANIFLALASTLYSSTSFSDLILWVCASSNVIRHLPAFLLRIGRARSLNSQSLRHAIRIR